MSWFKPDRQSEIEARVEAVRYARRKQGHDLTLLQEAIVRTIAESAPETNPHSDDKLSAIKAAISTEGKWREEEEWRIMTWFESEIVRIEREGQPRYVTAVSCDRQNLTCECPSIERAYAFMRFYQKLILEQFYSVGPPWADINPFPN